MSIDPCTLTLLIKRAHTSVSETWREQSDRTNIDPNQYIHTTCIECLCKDTEPNGKAVNAFVKWVLVGSSNAWKYATSMKVSFFVILYWKLFVDRMHWWISEVVNQPWSRIKCKTFELLHDLQRFIFDAWYRDHESNALPNARHINIDGRLGIKVLLSMQVCFFKDQLLLLRIEPRSRSDHSGFPPCTNRVWSPNSDGNEWRQYSAIDSLWHCPS